MIAGTLIKEARKRGGLTQAELAALAGTRQSAIGRWERAEVDPGFDRVRQLTRLCGFEMTFELANADSSYGSSVDQTLATPVRDRVDQMTQSARGYQQLRKNFIEGARAAED